jgi:NAD(P) transhydrogenase subunit alpha
MTPDTVKRLTASGVVVRVESGAGLASGHSDDAYVAAGATIVPDADGVYDAQVVIKVQKPNPDEAAQLRRWLDLIALLQPMSNIDLIQDFAERGITTFSMDASPALPARSRWMSFRRRPPSPATRPCSWPPTRYRSSFPMLTTAAGSIIPAKVLVVGAGCRRTPGIATAAAGRGRRSV